MRMLRSLVTITVACAAIVSPAASQSSRASFSQFSLGAGTSEGGRYMDRGELTFDAMFGKRIGSSTSEGRAMLAGFALAGSFNPASGDVCLLLPGGGCAPRMPRFGVLAAVGGIETRGDIGTFDIVAGPAAFISAATKRVGAMVRLDAVSPPLGRVALVVSPRLLIIPNVADATLTLRSLNVGVRVR